MEAVTLTVLQKTWKPWMCTVEVRTWQPALENTNLLRVKTLRNLWRLLELVWWRENLETSPLPLLQLQRRAGSTLLNRKVLSKLQKSNSNLAKSLMKLQLMDDKERKQTSEYNYYFAFINFSIKTFNSYLSYKSTWHCKKSILSPQLTWTCQLTWFNSFPTFLHFDF